MALVSLSIALWRFRIAKQSCKKLTEAIAILEEDEWTDGHAKIGKVDKYLTRIRSIILALYNRQEYRPMAEVILRRLSFHFLLTGAFLAMIKNIVKLQFEARKCLAELFVDSIYYSKIEQVYMAEKYFIAEKSIVNALLAGYHHHDATMQCGFMLREVLRFPKVAKRALYSGEIFKLLELSDYRCFATCSEAYISLKCVMVWHTELVSKFLRNHSHRFSADIVGLLRSTNYAVRINTTKLFINILKHKNNFTLMASHMLNTQTFNALLHNFVSSSIHLHYLTFCVYKAILIHPTGLEIMAKYMEYKEIVFHFIKLARYHPEYTDRDKFLIAKAYVTNKFSRLII